MKPAEIRRDAADRIAKEIEARSSTAVILTTDIDLFVYMVDNDASNNHGPWDEGDIKLAATKLMEKRP